MLILAFDTSSTRCDACVYDCVASRILGEDRLELAKGHAEHLISVIDRALLASGSEYGDIDTIAVTIGPGSFTGVRVGVSAARGFALALGIPAIGISTLDGLAHEARAIRHSDPICVSIDARRDEVYARIYSSDGTPLCDPQATSAAAIAAELPAGCILAGSGSHLVAAAMKGAPVIVLEASSSPDVETIAKLAGATKPPFGKPKPLYLRRPDAKVQQGLAVARAEQ